MNWNKACRWHIKAITAVAAYCLLLPAGAQAITNQAPDPADYGGAAGHVRLILANTSNIVAKNISVPLYVKSGSTSRPGNTTVNVSMVIQRKAGADICVGGQQFSTDGSFTVPSSDFSWDAINQLWRTDINVSMCGSGASSAPIDNNSILFRLVAPSGYLFGYTPPAGGGLFTTDSASIGTGFYNYALKFATPCDIRAATTNTIRLDDLDSGSVSNGNQAIGLQIRDANSGAVVSYSGSGGMGDGGQYNMTMQFQPRGRYVLNVNNVYYVNALIYRIPYDNIAYLNGCPNFRIDANTTVQTSATNSGPWGSAQTNTAANPLEVTPGTWLKWSHGVAGTSGEWYGRTVNSTFRCSTQPSGGAVTERNNSTSKNVTMGMANTDSSRDLDEPTTGDCSSPWQASGVGTTYCHWISYGPYTDTTQYNNSNKVCVKVVSGIVTPELKFSSNGAAVGSALTDGLSLKIDFNASNRTNPGAPTPICYVAKIWYETAGVARPPHFIQSSQGTQGACVNGTSPIDTIAANATRTVLANEKTVDMTQGGRICAEWYIQSTNSQIGTGSPNPVKRCVAIGNSPTVHVWGNDLRVGSSTQLVRAQPSEVASKLTSTVTGEAAPVLALDPATTPISAICAPFSGGAAQSVLRAGERVDTLKRAYGAPQFILASRYGDSNIAARYIKPSTYINYTGGWASSEHVRTTEYDSTNSCLEISYERRGFSAYIEDQYAHLRPEKSALWWQLANTAFVSGDSGSTIRTAGSTPKNRRTSLGGYYNDPRVDGTVWDLFFKSLIAPYDPAYLAKPSAQQAADKYKDPYNYQLWSVGGDETADQSKQDGYIRSDMTASAGASAYRHTFDVDCSQMCRVDPNNQESTGLILFAMTADDFAAAYLNGKPLSGDVRSLPAGDVVHRSGRVVTIAVNPASFNAPDPATNISKGNVLTVINLDKTLFGGGRNPSDVGVGVMYSMLYFAPKAPPTASQTYGSWAEYGVLAPKTVTNYASGAGLVNGNPSSDQSAWSKLTFSNDMAPYGNFAPAANMGVTPNIAGYFARAPMPGKKLTPAAPGDVTVSAGSAIKPSDLTQPGGRVLDATGRKVIIRDNITLSPGTGTTDMQQIVIIADDIEIAGNVTQVDAWLIASKSINTCNDVAVTAPLSSSLCNRHLDVNGALTAATVYLRRTGGGGPGADRTTSAETLNLRGDAYIWARRISEENGTWQTRSVVELPPRY